MFEELSLHVLDIGMNSIAAGASCVRVTVTEDTLHDSLTIAVADDGSGMDEPTLQSVLARSTTSKATRRKNIGLGLALLRQTAESCNGAFHVVSAPGQGTTVTAKMQLTHVDLPPVGDLNATILALCAAAPQTDIRLVYRTDHDVFEFSSQELSAPVRNQQGVNT
jgi:hypothetical protein